MVVDGARGAAPSGRTGAVGAGWVPTPARAGTRAGARRAAALVHALVVHLGLVVDRLLDFLGVADVAERRGPVVAGRTDVDVAGPDDAFEHPLLEPDVVDLLQRDLDRALRDPALTLDHPVARDHEVGGEPAHQLAQGIDDERYHHHRQHDHVEVELVDQPDPHGYRDERDQRGQRQRDRVRTQVQHQLLTGDQESLRERHCRTVPPHPEVGQPAVHRPPPASAQMLELAEGSP